MASRNLTTLLNDARSLRGLARALGLGCLDAIKEVDELRRNSVDLEAVRKNLEAAVTAIRLEWWFDRERAATGFADLLGFPGVEAPAALLLTAPPLAYLAVLRAMCLGALNYLYHETWESIELERGDPAPMPIRPTHTAFAHPTPSFSTLSARSALAGTPFRLYGGPIEVAIEVRLDFADRDNLDAATWDGDESFGRFPLIASVHPHASEADLTIEEVLPETFFGVRPRNWDEEAVLAQLQAASDARIAVLPELCAPNPEALGEALSREPGRFPALVVAGSAHTHLNDETTSSGGARVNAAAAYLHGAPLIVHRKVHPFVAKYLGEQYSRRRRQEDLHTLPGADHGRRGHAHPPSRGDLRGPQRQRDPVPT